MKKNKKRFFKLSVLFWALVLIYACYTLAQQQFAISDLQKKGDALNVKISDAKNENEELHSVESIADTDEYYETIARRKLGFVKPNEKVFIDMSK